MKLFYLTEPVELFQYWQVQEGIYSGITVTSECQSDLFERLKTSKYKQDTRKEIIWQVTLPKAQNTPPSQKDIYLATFYDVQMLYYALRSLKRADTLKVLNDASARILYDSDQTPSPISALLSRGVYKTKRKRIRIAILNPFYRAFGDSLIACTAIREIRRQLEQVGYIPQITILNRDFFPTFPIYQACRAINSVAFTPLSFCDFQHFDYFIDFSPISSSFSDRPLIDDLFDRCKHPAR